jgi:hypothetical protein
MGYGKGMKKNMKNMLYLMLMLLFILGGTGIALSEKEVGIPLNEVPEKVMEAARKAVRGITFTEAEVRIEKTDHGFVYELEGESDGSEYEVYVSSHGTVLKVEP